MYRTLSIKNATSLLPAATVFIYICGYIIISGFLSKYHVAIDELFSVSILKAGILFSIIIVPICIILYLNFEDPTDDFLKAKKYYPALLINLFSYLFFISIFLINFNECSLIEKNIFYISFMVDLFIFFLSTSYAMRNVSNIVKFLLNITIPIIIICYFGYKYSYIGNLYFIIITVSIAFLIHLGCIYDKKYSIFHLSVLIIAFFYITYLFGLKVYGNISLFAGGVYHYRATILIKPSNSEYLQKVGFLLKKKSDTADVNVIYTTTDKFLLENNKKIFYISKSLFNGFIINNYKVKLDINKKKDNE